MVYNLIDKIKRYFTFNKEEMIALIGSSLVIGFMFAFRDFTLFNLATAIGIVFVSILFHISVQKIAALHDGFSVEFKIWWLGLLIGLVTVFMSAAISNNKIIIWWLALPGGIVFSMLAKHRLGKFRYGMNYWPMGIIAFSGPIASIVFGTIFKNINLYILGSGFPLFDKIFIFNLVLAATQMLPIPPLDGHYMFFASRSAYAFLLGTIITYVVLVLGLQIFSWVWAIIIGAIIWLVYYIKFERVAW
jgi:hypothetical protein